MENGEYVMKDGRRVRTQPSKVLAPYCDRYRSERDVQPLLDLEIARAEDARHNPQSTMSWGKFFDQVYLPHITTEKRASTIKGYNELWANHVKARLGDSPVRDLRTVDVSHMLRDIAANNDLTSMTLRHIKAFCSGLVEYARNEGLFDGANPVHGVIIPKARRSGETYAYNLEQILATIDALEGLAKAVVAVTAFAGLRSAEIRGLGWDNYDGQAISVKETAWRSNINRPKSIASEASVPVISPLHNILEVYREGLGSPCSGVMFPGVEGPHVDLDKLGSRVVAPAMSARGIEWHGWHAFRRGLASNLSHLGVSDKVVQRILRHARVTVTQDHYIKAFAPDVLEAMGRLAQAVEVNGGSNGNA